MKLTKSIRVVIIKQFKIGEPMDYLAKLYGFSVERIEQVIREEMIERDSAERMRELHPLMTVTPNEPNT